MIISIRKTIVCEVSIDGRKRLRTAEKRGLCPACMRPLGGKRIVRGIHESCHKATLAAISKGQFTEESRIKEGKLLPSQKPGRKPSNPVTIEAEGT